MSFIERCPLFRVPFIRGSTVYQFSEPQKQTIMQDYFYIHTFTIMFIVYTMILYELQAFDELVGKMVRAHERRESILNYTDDSVKLTDSSFSDQSTCKC